jgi:hypothetical protein
LSPTGLSTNFETAQLPTSGLLSVEFSDVDGDSGALTGSQVEPLQIGREDEGDDPLLGPVGGQLLDLRLTTENLTGSVTVAPVGDLLAVGSELDRLLLAMLIEVGNEAIERLALQEGKHVGGFVSPVGAVADVGMRV